MGFSCRLFSRHYCQFLFRYLSAKFRIGRKSWSKYAMHDWVDFLFLPSGDSEISSTSIPGYSSFYQKVFFWLLYPNLIFLYSGSRVFLNLGSTFIFLDQVPAKIPSPIKTFLMSFIFLIWYSEYLLRLLI